jgi:hypothetical protein
MAHRALAFERSAPRTCSQFREELTNTLALKTLTVHFTFETGGTSMRRTIAFLLLLSVTAFWSACSIADNTNSNATTAVTATPSPTGTATPSNANVHANMNASDHANMNMSNDNKHGNMNMGNKNANAKKTP